ncbi:hypothetical protein PCANC_27461 [Puccinia coronata f. sp. avenae]|uniref:Uncharacterized protein n=1 Tax=Puccinia coronata f. sp. avenae TaxID=200324 RepID=A0A2N5S1G9_9BASI|nr:hypothetical protein PCANC_27461 [Puccinia coronata f. sp. avenae]
MGCISLCCCNQCSNLRRATQPSLSRLDYKQKLVQHTASALPCSQLIVYLLTELVPAQQAGIPAHRAGASPASRYTCSPSWCQPSEQVYLLTKLVPAQRAGIPAHQAGASPASRYTCSPSWCQPHRAGIPAHQAGASPASRYICSPSWCQPSEQYTPSWCQPSKQVYLLTKLVPAQQAGIPAHRAGASPAGRYTCSPSWCQPSEQVYLLTKLEPAQWVLTKLEPAQ